MSLLSAALGLKEGARKQKRRGRIAEAKKEAVKGGSTLLAAVLKAEFLRQRSIVASESSFVPDVLNSHMCAHPSPLVACC